MNELVITTVALLNVTCWPLSIAGEVFNTQWLHHKESNQCTLSLGGFLYKVMWKNLTDAWGHQDNDFTSMNIVCKYRIRMFVWFLFSPLPQLKHGDTEFEIMVVTLSCMLSNTKKYFLQFKSEYRVPITRQSALKALSPNWLSSLNLSVILRYSTSKIAPNTSWTTVD